MHAVTQEQIKTVRKELQEMKKLMITMDKRVYNIHSKLK